MVEEALVVLAQAVVVLVVGRNKRCADDVEGRVAGPAVVTNAGRAVFVIGHRLGPAGHLQQLLAFRCPQRNVRARRGAIEILGDVDLRLHGRMRGGQVLVHRGHNSPRMVHVGLRSLGCDPAFSGGLSDDSIPRPSQRRIVLQAQRDAENVGRIRLQHNGLSLAVEFQALAGCLCCDYG